MNSAAAEAVVTSATTEAVTEAVLVAAAGCYSSGLEGALEKGTALATTDNATPALQLSRPSRMIKLCRGVHTCSPRPASPVGTTIQAAAAS